MFRIEKAQFSTAAGTLRISEGCGGMSLIEILLFNVWMEVRYSKIPDNFMSLFNAHESVTLNSGFLLTLSASDTCCTSGAQSPETVESNIANRFIVTASEAKLTEMR